MPQYEDTRENICALCLCWHPNMKYSQLLGEWFGEGCLLAEIEKNPGNQGARIIADELGIEFTDDSIEESICDFCGNGGAVVIDEANEKKICQQCWSKIKL